MKLRSDDERRAELKRMRLVGERDQLAAKRHIEPEPEQGTDAPRRGVS